MEKITSAANPAVKRLKALSDAKGRKEQGAFLVEGEVMVREALASGLNPLEALFEAETPLSGELAGHGALVRLCDRHILETVCDTRSPQGCCAAFTLPDGPAIPQNASRLLALDGVQDPGNLGTILRTADAAGFEGAYLSPLCADVYSPKVQRAAMGSGFRVPALRCLLEETLTRLKAEGWQIAVSALDGLNLYENEKALSGDKLILVIGNEARGVSPGVQKLSDIRIKIPMRGKAESLNAAVAAGILMYELTKNFPC
jgi:TrmH family RNA methyltransferase